MSSRKQVFLVLWSIVWVITVVDGAVVQKNKRVFSEITKTVVDKSPNALKVLQEDLKLIDVSARGYTHDTRRKEQRGFKFDEEAEVSSIEDNHVRDRSKRQSQYETEILQDDPNADEAHSMWQEFLETMRVGAKNLMEKLAKSLDREPERGASGY